MRRSACVNYWYNKYGPTFLFLRYKCMPNETTEDFEFVFRSLVESVG